MKIVSIGGGPAGLYLAILLKQSDPRHSVTVLERNRPGETFGFGVVFSDATLGALAEADRVSYEQIAASFAHWDDIEIFLDTRRTGAVRARSTGHGFCGLERRRLLEILQGRCQELGVELRFETELPGMDGLDALGLGDADLVAVADGVSSAVRGELAAIFEPRIEQGANRFVWLGTTLPFSAFTFLFKENQHGLWRVHAYRYAADRSTFIVECTDETFQRAGLAVHDEDATIAYLEALFAGELGGHRLIKNRSIWRNFPTVRNRRWHSGRAVLLGDAAHTAHFSIGSGTKLAMEDAIALAGALREGADVPLALGQYEARRRPEVEALQAAAAHSLAWFEHTERYLALPLPQFTFSLLSRSLRVTHGGLRRRDPALVAELDAWFAARAREAAAPGAGSGAATAAAGAAAAAGAVPPPMFTPFRLRELVLPHRVVAAPVALEAAEAGCAGDGHLVHLGARAQGAAALVYCERTSVAPAPGRGLALYTDEQVVALRRVAGFVQSSGSALAVPLWAEGSALAQWGDVTRLCDAFVRAARRADEAGVDLLELDCSTGLLAAILASARERGGIRDRGRPILEVIGALRRAWPERKPLALRLAPSPAAEVALADDAVTLAGLFRQCGGDLVSVASAQPTPERLATAPLADRIRNECVVPTLCEGGIASCADINSLLAAGRADLCGLGRATLFDPAFARHAAASQRVDLPLVGHLGALATYRPRLSLD